jgi:hypothetical protein
MQGEGVKYALLDASTRQDEFNINRIERLSVSGFEAAVECNDIKLF